MQNYAKRSDEAAAYDASIYFWTLCLLKKKKMSASN